MTTTEVRDQRVTPSPSLLWGLVAAGTVLVGILLSVTHLFMLPALALFLIVLSGMTAGVMAIVRGRGRRGGQRPVGAGMVLGGLACVAGAAWFGIVLWPEPSEPPLVQVEVQAFSDSSYTASYVYEPGDPVEATFPDGGSWRMKFATREVLTEMVVTAEEQVTVKCKILRDNVVVAEESAVGTVTCLYDPSR